MSWAKKLFGEFKSREDAYQWAQDAYGDDRPDISWVPVMNGKGTWSLEITSWPLD